MQPLLTEAQRARYAACQEFVGTRVAPGAEQWDREQRLPANAIAALGQAGYLGACMPVDYGGRGWDVVTFGLLSEALGRGSAALAGVVTVQSMVSTVLAKWGTKEQKHCWLPRLASGQAMASFALTEPTVGSALHAQTTTFTRHDDGLVLNGTKKWISCAQFADVFLVFGTLDRESVACLVPRETPGLAIEPIEDLMGFRAAGLAEVRFRDVTLPRSNIVGKPGYAWSHVAPMGLHYGRLSTACSAAGLLRGCFEESTAYAARRQVGDKTVGEFGAIRSLIARMGTQLEAATWLCLGACHAEDERRPDAYMKASMAKYFTSTAVVSAASDAVQIRGASGCHGSSAVSRYYRDAKIMEIIEGTTQVHEDILAALFIQQASPTGRAAIPA